VVAWLLDGDVAVAHQTTRDLLHREEPGLRARIGTEGEGAALLAARRPDGHWGRGFYQPKWTSTHYTLLELRNLGLPGDHPAAVESVNLVLAHERGPDGGLDPSHRAAVSDACINGMGLRYASWFGAREEQLAGLVDLLLSRVVADGGFNCQHRPPRTPVSHSSLHTTVSVLEGFTDYLAAGHRHRRQEVVTAVGSAVEFVLRHQLFRSERTGEVIRQDFLVPHHPPAVALRHPPWTRLPGGGGRAARPADGCRARGAAREASPGRPLDRTDVAGADARARRPTGAIALDDAHRPAGHRALRILTPRS
jgi:hypothetical protein